MTKTAKIIHVTDKLSTLIKQRDHIYNLLQNENQDRLIEEKKASEALNRLNREIELLTLKQQSDDNNSESNIKPEKKVLNLASYLLDGAKKSAKSDTHTFNLFVSGAYRLINDTARCLSDFGHSLRVEIGDMFGQICRAFNQFINSFRTAEHEQARNDIVDAFSYDVEEIKKEISEMDSDYCPPNFYS